MFKTLPMDYFLFRRYGASMAVPRLHCPERILVNFIAEIATLFSIPTTPETGKKITFCAVGLERIASR